MEGSDGTVLLGYSVGRGGPAEGAGVGASGAELWVGGETLVWWGGVWAARGGEMSRDITDKQGHGDRGPGQRPG